MYRTVILASLLLTICLLRTFAQAHGYISPLQIDLGETDRAYPIGQQLEVFEDKSAHLSFQEILMRDSLFKPSRQHQPNFGLSTSAVWCRLSVINKTSQEWYLEVGTPYLQEVTLYQQLPDNQIREVRVSSDIDFTRRPIQSNMFVLPLKAPYNVEQRYYLRVRSNFILHFPLRIATLQRVYEDNVNNYIVMGIYFGLLLTLILYNLFVYIVIKDQTYLYYIGFLMANGLYVGYTSGFGLAYLYPHQPWLNQSNYYGAAAQIFGVLFTHSFLQVRQHVPGLRWLSWIILLVVAGVLTFTAAGQTLWGFRLLVFNVMFVIPYVYIMGISVYRKGFKPAIFYMLAFTIVNTGVLIYCLQNLVILPQNAFTGNAYMLGSALEVVVLSFALAYKLNTFKKEKERAQIKALTQAAAFSQQLIATQEHERKRIAAELHDSVGQSLGLLKNRLLLLQQKRQTVLPANMEEMIQSVGQTIQEVRNISYALRPVQLDLQGLTTAIKNLVEETASASDIQFYEEIDNIDSLFSKEGEMNLYRIVQECLSNMVRHAQATEGKILVVKDAFQLVIRIEDNGKGIAASGPVTGRSGSGLPGIRERLHMLKGMLEISEASPYGTILLITIPISLNNEL